MELTFISRHVIKMGKKKSLHFTLSPQDFNHAEKKMKSMITIGAKSS